MKSWILCAALVILAVPARAQEGLEALFTGKDFPPTLKLRDLNGSWRRFTVTTTDNQGSGNDMMSQLMQIGMMSDAGKGGASDAIPTMAAMSLFGAAGKEPVYYTTGRTITLGGDTFLVAYRYKAPQVNFMQLAMESEKSGGKAPDFAKLSEGLRMTPESAVSLSLVNIRAISSLNGLRPFDLDQEIAEDARSGGGMLDALANQKGAATRSGDAARAARPAGSARPK